MGLDRETLKQIRELIRPLSTRIANGAARAVVELTDDGPKLQLLQVGVLAGETLDDAEHFQPYGFSSVPLGGAEAVVVFPNGDRAHPLVVVVSDRRYRPVGGEPGEVTVYNHTGAKVTITKDGDIKIQAAAGREVLVDDGAGGTEPLVKRSEFLRHGHATAATGAVSPPMVAPTSTPSATFPGTSVLKGK
jgi:phage baseplate assembly protein V